MQTRACVSIVIALTLGVSACAEMLGGPDGVERTQAAVIAAGAAADVAKEKEEAAEDAHNDENEKEPGRRESD